MEILLRASGNEVLSVRAGDMYISRLLLEMRFAVAWHLCAILSVFALFVLT